MSKSVNNELIEANETLKAHRKLLELVNPFIEKTEYDIKEINKNIKKVKKEIKITEKNLKKSYSTDLKEKEKNMKRSHTYEEGTKKTLFSILSPFSRKSSSVLSPTSTKSSSVLSPTSTKSSSVLSPTSTKSSSYLSDMIRSNTSPDPDSGEIDVYFVYSIQLDSLMDRKKDLENLLIQKQQEYSTFVRLEDDFKTDISILERKVKNLSSIMIGSEKLKKLYASKSKSFPELPEISGKLDKRKSYKKNSSSSIDSDDTLFSRSKSNDTLYPKRESNDYL